MHQMLKLDLYIYRMVQNIQNWRFNEEMALTDFNFEKLFQYEKAICINDNIPQRQIVRLMQYENKNMPMSEACLRMLMKWYTFLHENKTSFHHHNPTDSHVRYSWGIFYYLHLNFLFFLHLCLLLFPTQSPPLIFSFFWSFSFIIIFFFFTTRFHRWMHWDQLFDYTHRQILKEIQHTVWHLRF